MSLINKYESSDNLSPAQLRRLRDSKIQKYMWVPEVLSRMLMGRMPTHTEVNYDDLYSAGLEELVNQMNYIYTDPKLVKRLWNEDKKDLTVGPFFLKGLKSPYINRSDSASVKFIKGAILDEMRKSDPATPSERSKLKKINKFTNEYQNLLGRNPSKKIIAQKLGISLREVNELLMVEGRR